MRVVAFLIFESGTFREPADPRRPRGSVSFCPSTLDDIARQRSVPAINQIAVAAGLVAAAIVALLVSLAATPAASIFGIAAPLCGLAMTGQIGQSGVGRQTRRPCRTKDHVTFIQSFFG